MILACNDLSFRIKNATLLDGLSLDVRPGETLGVIGPNGSGKSTLLRLLAGLITPTAGHVTLHGQPLQTLKRRDIARQLALVEQQAESDDALQVRDVVELGRTPWLSPLAPWSADDDRIVREALESVEMQGMIERTWHSLSGGERQRVHIARALAQQTGILLLDEPTNHLDIRHQLNLLQLIHRLPLTCVIALHDLNQALTCDRVALLDYGRLVAIGEPQAVVTPDNLLATFGVRASLLTDPADGSHVLRFHPH